MIGSASIGKMHCNQTVMLWTFRWYIELLRCRYRQRLSLHLT
jgi:hypothetical protein